MRRIFVFMNISLDGYFETPQHDLSWARNDFAFEAYSPEAGRKVDAILLGHRTYEMMESFWPTEPAAQMAPEIARFMNETRKVVASRQTFEPRWQNVTVISGDVPGEVRTLKEQPGGDMIIFGSNNLCVSLIPAGLIDEFQILVNPVALGEGTSLFRGLAAPARLTLAEARPFQSGNVLLTYRPAER